MADVKFSELSSLSAAASADVFAIVDSSESASKQLTIDNLFGAVPVNLAVTDVTQSSSNTTGSITTTGGIGVSKAAFVGGNLNVFGDADVDGTTNLDAVDIDGAVQIDAAVTVGIAGTGQDVTFYGDTSGKHLLWDQSGDELLFATSAKLSFHDAAGGENILASADGHLEVNAGTTLDITAPTVDINVATTLNVDGATQLTGAVTIGVDGTGHDVQLFGDTASSVLLWDQSDDQLEFGNAAMTISDARTSVTQSLTGLTIDMYNKLDTGTSNDRIGAAISTYGDTNAYTIRDSVGIRAMSRQSTGAEVSRLNTPIHAVLDLANTAIANNSGTTLSGAYGLAIDHDDTIATRTGQPTAFISFGEMYVGGTASIETAYLFDIFPNGKTGDATYATAADVAFYDDGACYASKKDVMILNSTDGAPASDAGDHVLMETDPYDSIQMEDNYMIETEDGEAILLETQDNVGTSTAILFETGAQDADGVLKIRVNGEDKYIQLYNYNASGAAYS